MTPEAINALVAAGILDKETADMIRRQLDPAAARAFAEATLTQATEAGLQAQQGRIVDLVASTDGKPSPAQLGRLWAGEDTHLWDALRPALLDIASERAALASAGSLAAGGGLRPELSRRLAGLTGGLATGGRTFDLINQGVLDWVERYYIDPDGQTFGSIPNLNLAGRTSFQRAFVAWKTGELEIGSPTGLQQLIDALEGTFGAGRAEVIAATETTRIFTETTKQAGRANPFTTSFRFLTSSDARVCGYCAPLHGQVVAKEDEAGFIHPTLGAIGWSPVHGRCRCSIVEETEGSLRVPFTDTFVYDGPLPSR